MSITFHLNKCRRWLLLHLVELLSCFSTHNFSEVDKTWHGRSILHFTFPFRFWILLEVTSKVFNVVLYYFLCSNWLCLSFIHFFQRSHCSSTCIHDWHSVLKNIWICVMPMLYSQLHGADPSWNSDLCGTWWFMIVFAKGCHWNLSWASFSPCLSILFF